MYMNEDKNDEYFEELSFEAKSERGFEKLLRLTI